MAASPSLTRNRAVMSGDGMGVVMMPIHRQAAVRAEGLVIIQSLLQRRLQPDGHLLLQPGFQITKQSHSNAPPADCRPNICRHPTTKPPKTERCPVIAGARGAGVRAEWETLIRPGDCAWGWPFLRLYERMPEAEPVYSLALVCWNRLVKFNFRAS